MSGTLKLVVLILVWFFMTAAPLWAEMAGKEVYREALSLPSERTLRMAFEVFYGAGDWERAYWVTKAGAERFPQRVFWWDRLVDLALWTNRPEEAYRAFSGLLRLVRKNPSYTRRLFQLARLLKRYDVVVELLESGRVPENEIPLEERIRAYKEAGKPLALIRFLEKTYSKNPRPSLREELASLYLQYDRPEKVLGLLSGVPPEALSIREAEILGYSWYLRGNTEKALEVLLAALEKSQGREQERLMRASAELARRVGRKELAASLLSRLPQLDKEERAFLFHYYFFVKHDFSEARKFADLKTFAWALAREKRWDLLRETLAQNGKVFDDPSLRSLFLTALLQTGNLKEAREFLEKARLKNKLGPEELDILAYFYHREGRWKELKRLRKELLRILLAREKLSPRERVILAHTLADLGRRREARKICLSLLKETQKAGIVLDCLDSEFLEGRRWKKLLDRVKGTSEILAEEDLRVLYDSKKAFQLAWGGRYEEAWLRLKEYEPRPPLGQDKAYYRFLSGERKEAVKLLEHLLWDSRYTFYEKKLIRWQMVEMENAFRNLLQAGMVYTDSSYFGWRLRSRVYGRIYFRENLFGLELAHLSARPELEYLGLPYRRLQEEDLLALEWSRLKGPDFLRKIRLYLLREGDLGAGVVLNDSAGDLLGNLRLFWNEPEEDEAPLSYFWSLRRGISGEANFRYRPWLLLGFKAGWREFRTPKFMPEISGGKKLGDYLNLEPYMIFVQKKENELYWQYGFGVMFVEGTETGDLRPVLPDRLVMPYVSLPGYWLFEKWRGRFFWDLTVGYLFSKSGGSTFEGLALTGRLELDLPLGRNGLLTGFLERSVDFRSGAGELKTGVALQWKF